MVQGARFTPRERAQMREEALDAHGGEVVAEREQILRSESLRSIVHELAANYVAALKNHGAGRRLEHFQRLEPGGASAEDQSFARQLAIDALQVAFGGPTVRGAIDRIHQLRSSLESSAEPLDLRSLEAFFKRHAQPRPLTRKRLRQQVAAAIELVTLVSPERARQLGKLAEHELSRRVDRIVDRLLGRSATGSRGRPIGARAKAVIVFEGFDWHVPPKPRKR